MHPDLVTLHFDSSLLAIGDDANLRDGLSAVAIEGQTMWLACDEGCRLERLTTAAAAGAFVDHRVFLLQDLLTLPAAASEEADIEGLDIDGGYLWLVGSHSVKRKKPKKGDSLKDIADRLEKTTRDGNRHLLARIPLHSDVLHRSHGVRTAASLDTTAESSALLEAIRAAGDRHLTPFVALPGKDNGFDIEGLVVRGSRVLVGLRGPVLREWCCILELSIDDQEDHLGLAPVDGATPYRKHFLKLNGLGIRDLAVFEEDLLILAGPPLAHDGPHEIWRWRNGARSGAVASPADIKRILTLPQREGHDRAEGLAAHSAPGEPLSAIVVYDAPAPERLIGESAVVADRFPLD